MKCPKCGYLGFEDVDRCRNCGYEFNLAFSDFEPEMPLRSPSQTPRPLDDLALIDAANAGASTSGNRPDLDRVLGVPEPVTTRPSEDLPLFDDGVEDQPLITRVSPPRPPLAVRRATPEIPRLRAEQPRAQALDLALDEIDDRTHDEIVTPAARASIGEWPEPRPERPENAAVSARLLAVLIDLTLLTLVDLLVVYFTMQICGLTLEDLGILPKGPLIAFLIVQNGGYLATFTAGGQTVGKMAAGIRVIATESAGTLDFGRALTRTIVWIMLAIPAGLGFLTLFSRDHRGLHDRFAGTRVVRASA